MRRNKSQHFLKPGSKNVNLIKTIRILASALSVALLGILLFCGIANGWDSVARFFRGSYFCMILVALLIIGTIVLWILFIVDKVKKVTENEEN